MDNKQFIETLRVVGKLDDIDDYRVKEICNSDVDLLNLWNRLNKLKKIYLGDKDIESINIEEFVKFVYYTFVFTIKELEKVIEPNKILKYLENHVKYDKTKDMRNFYRYLSDFSEIAATSKNDNFYKLREVAKTTDMEICGKKYEFSISFVNNKYQLLHDRISGLNCGCLIVKDEKIDIIPISDIESNLKIFDKVLYDNFDYMVIPSLKLYHSSLRSVYTTKGRTNKEYLEYLLGFIIDRDKVDLDRYWNIYECKLNLEIPLNCVVFTQSLDLNIGLDLIYALCNTNGVDKYLKEINEFFIIMRDMLDFRDINKYVRELTSKIVNIKDINDVMNRLKYINKSEIDKVHSKAKTEEYCIHIDGEVIRYNGIDIIKKFKNDNKIGIYKNGIIKILDRSVVVKDCVMVLR